MNNKMKSIPLKALLLSSLNTRLSKLEKTSIAEMKDIKDFNLQIKTMKTMLSALNSKCAALISLLAPKAITITKPSPNRTLKHDKSQKKLVKRVNMFDAKNKPEPKRVRAFTAKKKPIKKKDADFEEIVRMHMIDFNRIEDDFSELKGNTTIQNDTMNINISLIDNDIDYFTNDFDTNEKEAINNLSAIKYPTKR